MRWIRAAGLSLVLAVLLSACSRPVTEPASPGTEVQSPAPKTEPAPAKPVPKDPQPPRTTKPANGTPATPGQPTRPGTPAGVTVEYRDANGWQPVSFMQSHLPPGPAELRLRFSRPVRRAEVEQALAEAQPAPVRGLLQWEDDQTLVWRIADMPPRLDLSLSEAHDQQGITLPGGLPSLRVGTAPTLVIVNFAEGMEQPIAALPPDIVNAALSPDGKFLNLMVWKPGAHRWDWQVENLSLDLQARTLKAGRVEGPQPRLTGELQAVTLNHSGTLLAGLRPAVAGQGRMDLVIREVRGGREQAFPSFVTQTPAAGETVYLAWSPDGTRIAAVADTDPAAPGAAVVAVEVASGVRSVLAGNVPLASGGARLSWSAGGEYLLAANLLVDTRTGAFQPLPGEPKRVRGVFAPEGSRLFYTIGDWEQLFLANPQAGSVEDLGAGLLVDWADPAKLYLIRWDASATRYRPPGQ